MTHHYRHDLAYIHHHGFSEFAESGAPFVIGLLPPGAFVVEVGCGSGVLARELTNAGFDVLGFDASPAMIELARKTAPKARFEVAAFETAELPACDAIIAMGEVLNYGDMRTFLPRAADALKPGGLLLFDVAERGSYPAYDEVRTGGDDWSVIAIKQSDGVTLTRRVFTFRESSRDEETHVLELYERAEVLSLLDAFRVKIRRSYGRRRLPLGHAVYVCVKRDRPLVCKPPGVTLRLQAILFDIDGTVVDSNDKHAECWIEAFAHFGKQVPWDVIRSQIGKGGDLLVPDTLNAREMRDFGEQLQEYRGELWKEKYMESVQPFPGAVEAMRAVHGRGVKIALASSSNPDEVEYYVELLGVGDLLKGTTSKEDAKFSKPSPEIFQAALERVKSDPARTLVAGDTPYDILAAHRIAVPIAAVRCGGFPEETLAKAEFLFDDLAELAKELERIDEYFRE
jgi:HAD superfamily hydrolase (TIGR01549 family)